ncbi:MAG: alpha-L-rhamnosidase, partial [Sphingobacteriia bacterium 35-40-5]
SKTYYWKVQEWDGAGKATAFSAVASFYLNNNRNDFSHSPLAASFELPLQQSREKNGTYYVDFGKDGFGQIILQLNAVEADSIYIEAAEAMDGGNGFLKNNGNIRYIKLGLLLQKGIHEYKVQWPVNEKRNSRNPIQMPNYIGEVFPFRYLAIRGYKGNLDKGMVKRKLVYYPFDEQASSFISSDTVLNKVWDLCKYSIKATSFSGYYVDGDRERVPYEADALINQLSHYAVDAEYSIARRSMAYLIDHPTWPTEWSLQNVLMAWNDYLYTGDLGYLKKYYPELQLKMLMPLEESNGLISTLTGKQTKDFLATIHITKAFDGKQDLKDIVDWPRGGGYIGKEKQYQGETDGFVFCKLNAVVNAFYYRNLVLMSKMAKVLNKEADAVFYEQKSKEAFQSYQEFFVDKSTGLVKDGDTTNHSSLHANMFALAFGL